MLDRGESTHRRHHWHYQLLGHSVRTVKTRGLNSDPDFCGGTCAVCAASGTHARRLGALECSQVGNDLPDVTFIERLLERRHRTADRGTAFRDCPEQVGRGLADEYGVSAPTILKLLDKATA